MADDTATVELWPMGRQLITVPALATCANWRLAPVFSVTVKPTKGVGAVMVTVIRGADVLGVTRAVARAIDCVVIGLGV